MDLFTSFVWDPETASHFAFDLITTTASATNLSTFPTPDLAFDLIDYPPNLDPFATPLFDCFPSPLPPLSSTGTSLTNTPVTTTIPSPPTGPPSPQDGALVPGLKLPQARSSKPGRRPAAASLSHVTEGRITKRTASTPALSPDDDPEVVSRRQRNNLAAKRYRQKKIDRIEELEDEVKQVKEERDDLRIRLARQEAEVAALREMLKMQKKSGNEGGSD